MASRYTASGGRRAQPDRTGRPPGRLRPIQMHNPEDAQIGPVDPEHVDRRVIDRTIRVIRVTEVSGRLGGPLGR